MQRSIRFGGVLCLCAVAALGATGCDGGVRASQNPNPKLSPKVSAQANPGTIEMDCEQLANLSMEAEVHAMGVQFSWKSNPASLNQNIQELQQSAAQIQALSLRHPQVEKLRNQYVTLLQSLAQTAQQSTDAAAHSKVGQLVNDRVKEVAKLRRDRIFFESCKK
jgi:hypothetical protein